ncbi:AhpC/TSA family protein [Glaciecola sp. MH2013]|uniref:peroxiredoxin-like family protein n=1 Tax=Glaciecola sp. MH2013 TaxID=2785524 RepID=UPI00189EFD19|nr:peroxiredoxin-like family protein [Glaciecola sp. MH2013]MBF7073526.1 AhpC/TSA family protein [Glaciecola sp. MH2013]
MKKWLLIAALAISTSMVSTAFALDRTVIADKAEDVTPILIGSSAPNVTVKTSDGSPVSLKALYMQKPTVVIFYRGGWCPYCSRQLAELKSIEQNLVDEGYQVLAISPESPSRLQEQKLETEFAVTLISDDSLAAIRGFGVGFYVPNDTRKLYKDRMNVELTADTSERAVLPAPAIFILDQQGKVQFSYVNPDYSVRPSADLVLSAAKLVKKES